MNILFVCTGNTCRSPMAEGLTRALAARDGKEVTTLSAGLFAAYGALPTDLAVNAVEDIVDISDHHSRPLSVDYVNAADLIIGMTQDHKNVLLRQFPFDADKIKTLSEWGGSKGDISDPFGQGKDVYDECAKQITKLVKAGLQSIDN